VNKIIVAQEAVVVTTMVELLHHSGLIVLQAPLVVVHTGLRILLLQTVEDLILQVHHLVVAENHREAVDLHQVEVVEEDDN